MCNIRRISISPIYPFILICMLLLSSCSLTPLSNNAQSDGEHAESGEQGEQTSAAGALTLRMLYGSEKQSWIEDVTATFNSEQHKAPNGQPIHIEAVPMGSLESMHKIIDGEEQPALWSPASSLVLPLANEAWAKTHNGDQLVEDAPALVLSPVVIAMWRPMAEALGWPDTPLGWEDIANFAKQDKTWDDYGHPEWGPFQFGHTHPDHSNSGFTTILASAYAATGKTRDLTVEDLQDPDVAKFIENLQRTVIHYGKSTGFFARNMINGSPSYLSAAVLYENLVMESYDREKYPNRSAPIVAIYPKEGTFWSDHPFAILPSAMQDDNMRYAAEHYRDYLLAKPQQERALQYGFRPVDTDIPIVDVITPDKGVDPKQPISVLDVPEANVMQKARIAWGQNKKRVEVIVLLDISGSMNEADPSNNLVRMVQAKQGLITFVEQLADADHMGLTVFNDEAFNIIPLDAVGPRREDILKRIEGLFADGKTRLIDTTIEAYEHLEERPRGQRIRAIVVLSDGADNMSTHTREELIDLVHVDTEGYGIKIFTIAYGQDDTDLALLQAIAEASGGTFYKSAPADIEKVYLDIGRFF